MFIYRDFRFRLRLVVISQKNTLFVYVTSTCSLVSASVKYSVKTDQPRYYSAILALAESSPNKLSAIQPGCKKNVYDKLVGIEKNGAVQEEHMQGLSEESGHGTDCFIFSRSQV